MKRLALLLALLCGTACVRTVPLNGAIAPRESTPERSSEKAGVVCGESLLTHVERANPSSALGFATRYELELGGPLCNALLRSVESSYRAAELAASPHKGRFNRLVRFELQKSALHILPQPNGSTRVVYTLSVVVERYGRELQRLGRNVVTGNSLVVVEAVTDAVVREAVESALQQVTDDTASLLVARLDGPRLRAAQRDSD